MASGWRNWNFTNWSSFANQQPLITDDRLIELFGSQYPGGKIFNSAAFTPVSAGQGDFGRNVLLGFGAAQLDLALQRQFHLTQRIGCFVEVSFSKFSIIQISVLPLTACPAPCSAYQRKHWLIVWAPASGRWPQSSLPDRRAALDPARAETSILSNLMQEKLSYVLRGVLLDRYERSHSCFER